MLRGVTFAGAFKEILHQVKPTLAENVRFGLSLTPERIARAFAFRGEMYARMREFLEGYDALAAPVCAGAGVRRSSSSTRRRSRACGWSPTSSYFRSCSRITVTSHPAIAVPAGFTPDGLPVGLQLVGQARGEGALLRARAPRAASRRA